RSGGRLLLPREARLHRHADRLRDRRRPRRSAQGRRRRRRRPGLLTGGAVHHRHPGARLLPPRAAGLPGGVLRDPGGDGGRDDRSLPGSGRRRLRRHGHRHRRSRERAGGQRMSTLAPTTEQEPRPAAAPQRRRGRLGDRLTAARAVPMAPAFLLLIGFMLGPIIYSVYLAFTDKAIRGKGAEDAEFVGFENFTDAFTDGDFWNSVVLTLIFTVVSAVI